MGLGPRCMQIPTSGVSLRVQTLRDTGKHSMRWDTRTSKDIRIRVPQTVWHYGISAITGGSRQQQVADTAVDPGTGYKQTPTA